MSLKAAIADEEKVQHLIIGLSRDDVNALLRGRGRHAAMRAGSGLDRGQERYCSTFRGNGPATRTASPPSIRRGISLALTIGCIVFSKNSGALFRPPKEYLRFSLGHLWNVASHAAVRCSRLSAMTA